MTADMMHQIEKMVLLFSIIFLPISRLPKRFTLPLLSPDLSEIFAVLGIILLIIEYFRFGFQISKKAKYFILIFTAWQFLCLGIGIILFPYHDLIMWDNESRIFKLFSAFAAHGVPINKELVPNLWLIYRSIKMILINTNMIFYVAFLVHHLYHNNYQEGFLDFRKAVLAMVLIMGAYSLIELCWLKTNNGFAKNLLSTINPYLYDIRSSHGWYPPLLWNRQLRSITREPSFFGIISVFYLPFLWSYLLEKKYISAVLIFYFTLMIFATNARTAVVVVVAELFLLTLSAFWMKKKDYTKFVIIILGISLCAFLGNLVNVNAFFHHSNQNTSMRLEQYYKKNIQSLSKKKSRSNNARFANLEANISVIKEHPLIGVGTGLIDGYIDDHLPESAYSDVEVRNWSRYLHMLGITKSGYPALNKYAFEATKNGTIGLVLFLLPFLYLGIQIIKRKDILLGNPYYSLLCIDLLGQCACWMSNSDFTNIKGFLLGILFCANEFYLQKR